MSQKAPGPSSSSSSSSRPAAILGKGVEKSVFGQMKQLVRKNWIIQRYSRCCMNYMNMIGVYSTNCSFLFACFAYSLHTYAYTRAHAHTGGNPGLLLRNISLWWPTSCSTTSSFTPSFRTIACLRRKSSRWRRTLTRPFRVPAPSSRSTASPSCRKPRGSILT